MTSAPNPRIVSLWDMLSNDAASFINTFTHVNRLAGLCESSETMKTAIGETGAHGVKSHAKFLDAALKHWEVPATVASVNEILALCEKSGTTSGTLKSRCGKSDYASRLR